MTTDRHNSRLPIIDLKDSMKEALQDIEEDMKIIRKIKKDNEDDYE